MKLVFDTREIKLINLCKDTSSNIAISTTPLDVGDIQICDDEMTPLFLFERKTISDLLSSITDGRYNEQSLRLSNHSLHNHHIFYIIEGSSFRNRALINSTICSLMCYKGFSVIRTSSLDDTKNFIYDFFSKIKKDPKRVYYHNKPSNTQNDTPDYCSSIKIRKKDNITADNIGQIMLMQIPGINDKTASALIDAVHDIPTLIDTIKTNPNSLYDVKCINHATGKSRKISKAAITTLIAFLSKTTH